MGSFVFLESQVTKPSLQRSDAQTDMPLSCKLAKLVFRVILTGLDVTDPCPYLMEDWVEVFHSSGRGSSFIHLGWIG